MIVNGERFESTNIPLENEDNCVLSNLDMENLEQTFDVYKHQTLNNKYEKQITRMLDKLFLKISKLNDLAKEKNK